MKKFSLMLETKSDEHTQPGEESDLGDVLDGVAGALRACSVLKSLTLWIDFGEAHESPAEAYTQEMDLDAVCATLHKAVPSAKYLQLTLWSHRAQPGAVEVEIESEGSNRE